VVVFPYEICSIKQIGTTSSTVKLKIMEKRNNKVGEKGKKKYLYMAL